MHPGGSSDKKGKSQIEKIVIEYHPEAADEFIEAAQFYESREKGQGDQMGRRKYVVKKFPYLLIYLDRSHPDQRQLKFLLIKKYLTSTTVGEFKQLFVSFIITYAAFQDRSPFLPKNSKHRDKNPGAARNTPTLPKKGQH
jgi:hypothetical protein